MKKSTINWFLITIIIAGLCEFSLIFIGNWKITCITTPIIILLFGICSIYVIAKDK